jgi:RNase H-fold protein (predicted Holliday junction resolvase)
MDALLQQFGAALLTYGPGGTLAFAFGIVWWFERGDRKQAQNKLEKALNDWNTDSKSQTDKLAAFTEKVSDKVALLVQAVSK